MSLYVFSMVVLSLMFMLVLGSWWDGSAPFKVHAAALVATAAVILSTILMTAIFSLLNVRSAAGNKRKNLDNVLWGRDISANLSAPAAVIDGYNLVFANKFFLAELGMAGMSEELIGMPLTNIVHPSDHHHLAKFLASAGQNRDTNDMVKLRLLCSDGTILPVQMALSPLREGGNTNLHLLQFSSVSSHTALPETYGHESDYRLLIDRIEQIVFQVNANREIIFINPSWERLLDHGIRESLRKPLISYIHPEDRPLAEARISSLTLGKSNSCLLEVRLITKNGNSCWFELRAKPTSTFKGERSSVIGTLTDIQRMKTTEASLRANRRSLSTLLSNIPGMVYRCKNDRNWSFEFASDGSLEVTGYEPYEMVNSPNFSFIQIMHPDDRQWGWEYVQRCVARQEKFQLFYRMITRSGRIKWVWEQGRGVYSSAGDLLALEGFITDVASPADDAVMQGFNRLFEEYPPV